MECPSTCVVRYEVGCSTACSLVWAWASNRVDASITETTKRHAETWNRPVQQGELERRIVSSRSLHQALAVFSVALLANFTSSELPGTVRCRSSCARQHRPLFRADMFR